MPREKSQKIKLLCLADLLRHETDAEHPMRTDDICSRLGEMGIKCDRHVLAKDVEILKSFGYKVEKCRISRSMGYYIDERKFELSELKIIMDALQAASFIPESKTTDLSNRISSLAGVFKEDLLKDNQVTFNSRKHTNEEVYNIVGLLAEAIEKHHQASFLYFDLDGFGKRVYRKSGERYHVEPVTLIYNEDYYYLVCYSPKYKAPVTYRIDRMEDVRIETEPVTKNISNKINNPAKITEQTFKMFNGKPAKITLEFDASLIGSVFDKFGEHIKIKYISPETCRTNVTVQVSPTFWGWLFGFGDKMRISAPDEMITEYIKRCKDIIKNQKTET